MKYTKEEITKFIRESKRRSLKDPNEIIIHNNYCEMFLYNRKGKRVASIFFNIRFLDKLKGFKWTRVKSRNTYYALHYCNKKEQKLYNKTILSMHQIILPCKNGLEVDHKDRNGLNNKLSNLRRVTVRGNAQNRSNNNSGYAGISWSNKAGKWRSSIYNKKSIHLGYFTNKKKAFEEREQYRKEHNLF